MIAAGHRLKVASRRLRRTNYAARAASSTGKLKWREYIKANPHAYAPGGEGYEKIRSIVAGLSHSELQVFTDTWAVPQNHSGACRRRHGWWSTLDSISPAKLWQSASVFPCRRRQDLGRTLVRVETQRLGILGAQHPLCKSRVGVGWGEPSGLSCKGRGD